MTTLRAIARTCAVALLGRERRPHRIVRGLAAGYRIYVSPAEKLGYLFGTDEPHLQEAIRQYVAAGDTVYDIGANVGYVSLSLAKRVGSGGSVIAFEPVPRNIEAFRQNIGINRLEQVRLMEYAASDKAGEAVIRMAGNLSTASLVWHRDNPSATELAIRTVVVDELVEARVLPAPAFAKIDVEGSEGAVLSGMQRTLAAAMPVVFVECSEAGREAAWQILRDLGYQCRSAISGAAIPAFEQYRHSDFLWLPAHRC
jgi:FkbM family methyltransferase